MALKKYHWMPVALGISLLFHMVTVLAQTDCGIDNDAIIETVAQVCANVGENEVCYGNNQVNAVARDGIIGFNFNVPGDSASLASIRSLYLSSLDLNSDTWGVAQMRLLVDQGEGPQDVTMLLFGDISIDNPEEEPQGIESVVQEEKAATIYNLPSVGALQIETVPAGTPLLAEARLENSFWIRVNVPSTGAMGWVLTSFITPTQEGANFDILPVESGTTPHLGAMQAFYFQSGTSTDCSETASDGMLIQTPEGLARVSFLINEVSIELTSASNGASAFIQANPEQESMAVNVIDGTAYVETGGQRQIVEAGMQTNIPISVDLSPIGLPSAPESFDANTIRSIPLLPIVRNPERPIVRETNPLPPSTSSIAMNITNQTQEEPSQNNSGSNTGNTGTNPIVDNTNPGNTTSAENTTNTNTGIPNLGGNEQEESETETEEDNGPISIINIILAFLAVASGIAFVAWLIIHSRETIEG